MMGKPWEMARIMMKQWENNMEYGKMGEMTMDGKNGGDWGQLGGTRSKSRDVTIFFYFN